jgi:flagellar biosynthesis/type III secretory pathway chaperone
MSEATLIDHLGKHLDQELKLHQQLTTIASDKRDQIVRGDVQQLAKLIAREQVCLKLGNRLRQEREELMRAFAAALDQQPERLRMAQILERVPEPLRGELAGKQKDLRGVLIHLREINDRNMVLIRQSLGFVRDLLGMIGNQENAHGYDQRGERSSGSGGGGLVDSKI